MALTINPHPLATGAVASRSMSSTNDRLTDHKTIHRVPVPRCDGRDYLWETRHKLGDPGMGRVVEELVRVPRANAPACCFRIWTSSGAAFFFLRTTWLHTRSPG